MGFYTVITANYCKFISRTTGEVMAYVSLEDMPMLLKQWSE